MPKQPASKKAGNQATQKPKAEKPLIVSAKERKQLAHKAPARRAASKARG